MVIKANVGLIHASFFFVDVVGLSDPTMSTKTQIKKITVLNNAIKECDAFKNTPEEAVLVLPTGDGMCLGFMQGPELPLLLSSQLHEQLEEYNKGKIPSETVRVRIGLHNGNCFTINDVRGQKNVWGPGIIMCRRVMDFGDDGHILMTPKLAEDLIELSDEYKQHIKPVHDFTIKHGTTILIYSAYGDGFGNPKHPTKGEAQRSKMSEEFVKSIKTTMYTAIKVGLTIKDPETMLTHHKRFYEIQNKTDEPIYHVLHGIATDVEKYSINDLNISVYDEKHRDLKISSINIDKPDCKEFTTQFSMPILKGEKGRSYTLEYDVEEPERYFENAFLIDCQSLELSIEYPPNGKLKHPALYSINQETDEKTPSDMKSVVGKNGANEKITWSTAENVKGQTLRIEW
ncbi:MAG: adenylate/guanylate cyclase domain-containing protein [Nitrosopumilaceae archaeon]